MLSAKCSQVVVLVIVLACVIRVHYGLHKNAHRGYDALAPVRWLQPPHLDGKPNGKFPRLIGNNNWQLNYIGIEEILWKSKTTASGKLLINTETADLLQQACAQLPDTIDVKELQRLTFLIEKSLPGSDGKKLASLANSFYFYQQEYNANLSAINNTVGDEKLALLKASKVANKQRQERYFGAETATKLFSKKNITTNYLNERRIINMSNDLSKAQKRQRLSELQRHYKNTLSN